MVRRDSSSSFSSDECFYSPPTASPIFGSIDSSGSPICSSTGSPTCFTTYSTTSSDENVLLAGVVVPGFVLEPFVASTIVTKPERPATDKQPQLPQLPPQQRQQRSQQPQQGPRERTRQKNNNQTQTPKSQNQNQTQQWNVAAGKRNNRSSSTIDKDPSNGHNGVVFKPKPGLVACYSLPQTEREHQKQLQPFPQKLSAIEDTRRRKEAEFRSMINKAIYFCRTSVIPTLLRAKENPGSVALKGCCARMSELGREVAAMPEPARRVVVREVKDELLDAYYIAFRELKLFMNARGIATFIHFLTRLGLRICEWCEFPYFIKQWYVVTDANLKELNRQGLSLIFGALVAQGHSPPPVFLQNLLNITDKILLSLSLVDAVDLLEMSVENQLARHLSMIFRGYTMLTDFMSTPERTKKFLALIEVAMEQLYEQELCGIVQGVLTLHLMGYDLQQQFIDRMLHQTTVVEILTNKGKRMRYLAYRYFDCHPYRAQRLLKEIKKAERPDDRYVSESESTVVHLLKYMARDYRYHVEPNLFIDAIASRVDAVLTMRDGRAVVIQFDGPHHFYHPNNIPCRKDLLQNRLLEKESYIVLRIPYYEVYYNTNNAVMDNLRKHLELDLGLKIVKQKAKKMDSRASTTTDDGDADGNE